MEYGLRLGARTELPGHPRDACPQAWRHLLPEGPAAALYFGTEFCEDLLPGEEQAGTFCALARSRGWEPTLLTPLVSPEGLRRVARLLDGLAAGGWRPAVVFNDWGVLGLLRERHPRLARRAGRLINRSLRDPRAYRHAPLGTATHDPSRYRLLRRWLAAQGVCALESDADLDGGYLGDGPDDGEAGLHRTLHLPFTFAASGRNCPLKAALYPPGEAFAKALADPCPGPCRGAPTPVPRSDTPLPHWRAGNTLFYGIPPEVARDWLPRAERIVVHAEAAA